MRFAAAATPAPRATVLAKFEGWYALDEPSALTLYRTDPDVAKDFILKHLPRNFWGSDKRKLWGQLFSEATARRDDDFAFAMYRKQIALKRWEQDILSLCEQIDDPQRLDAELQRRHPEGWGLDLGGVIYGVAERRKRDVLPYVFRHLRDIYGHLYRSAYDKLLGLAVREHWLDLWAAIIRTCARPQDFNREINRLLDDPALPELERERRLVMLTGASREWNFPGLGLAQVHALDEKTALRLYQRSPNLVRGPFKLHVAPAWGEAYEKLVRRLIDTGDEPLLDFMASRLVTRTMWTQKLSPAVEMLADYYTSLRLDEAAFCRRAAAVLTQVPAYTIYNYNQLIRDNRLARLLFERSARSYLANAASIRDLVEGSEIHVQALAYRTLGLDDERARQLSRDMLDILLGTLLRPLKRKTRALAFGALKNAASTPDAALVVLGRARLALDLPDKRYPKEELVGLIGDILWRHPDLRDEAEQPLVYEHAGRLA